MDYIYHEICLKLAIIINILHLFFVVITLIPPDERELTRTLVFKATPPSRKSRTYDWLEVPDIQSTNAITYVKATDTVKIVVTLML